MAKDPFAKYRTNERPDIEQFAHLNELVNQLDKAEQDVVEAETTLKEAQERQRRLEEFEIPDYMDTLGLEEFTLTSGLTIEVVRKIRASIGNRKVAAFKWLIDKGHGGLIKRTIMVAFNREQSEDAHKLLKTLQPKFAGVKEEMKVEAASLTASI
jgi:hypothetical protein